MKTFKIHNTFITNRIPKTVKGTHVKQIDCQSASKASDLLYLLDFLTVLSQRWQAKHGSVSFSLSKTVASASERD